MLAAQRLDPLPGIEEQRGAKAGRQLIRCRDHLAPFVDTCVFVPFLVKEQAQLSHGLLCGHTCRALSDFERILVVRFQQLL
ncbi:hypothetical protein D9M72_547460 [compost metagenome]